MNKKALIAFSSLLMIGCSSFNFSTQKCDPSYFLNYSPKDGEIVGIGIAPMNINGEYAQKKSAIAKAINEIAAQKGVKVNSAFLSNIKVINSSSNSYMQSYSVHSINGKTVRAKIVKECKGADGKYYILMKAY